MEIFPNEQEIDQTSDILVNKCGVSQQLLSKLLGKSQRDQANYLLQKLGTGRLTKLQIARLLVLRKGPELFCGSTKPVKELRLKLLSSLTDKEISFLCACHPPTKKKINSLSFMRKPLSEMKWVARGPWPIDFVKILGFPEIFAGVRQTDTKPTVQDISPLGKPPGLADFQLSLKDKMLAVLAKEGDKTRCMVTLPTGTGKTSVAVESFIHWMEERFANRQYMVWIAQSEELCEQAVACIQQIWGSKEYPSALRIYRYFGGRDIPTHELSGGAVICSIQQIHNRIKGEDKALDIILKNTGAMIIDEAHHADSKMYTSLLDRARKLTGPDMFPICGLTATPGKAGSTSKEKTLFLADRFQWYLVNPKIPASYDSNPLKYFREGGYIASPHHILINSHQEYELTDQEIEQMKSDPDLPKGFLKRLASDNRRNTLIVKRLLQIPKGKPTLFYACTVEHAYFISIILEASGGRNAAAISSDTPMTIRRGLIDKFKRGEIDFLCNFGVLTTGFDAPKTECIAIARPTTSQVLYEQIVGRGLRGPKFGGTKSCDVIDFADNIKRLGQPLSYARFQHLWVSEKKEN